jgi:hypothetical protein
MAESLAADEQKLPADDSDIESRRNDSFGETGGFTSAVKTVGDDEDDGRSPVLPSFIDCISI